MLTVYFAFNIRDKVVRNMYDFARNILD